jgi:hypothetical protein
MESIPAKTTYCWGCGQDRRDLSYVLSSWLCQVCIKALDIPPTKDTK